MGEQNDQARNRIIDGQASSEEAERFIGDLEGKLVSALNEAASATNRLAAHKKAAEGLVRMLPRIAGEDDKATRATLANQAIEQHQATAGE
jgi:hypothetical protein